MDERTVQRMMRMQSAIEQSAYTLALAKNQSDPAIKETLERMEGLENSIKEQTAVVQKLQQELKVDQEHLKELLKPHADKEMVGIENAS